MAVGLFVATAANAQTDVAPTNAPAPILLTLDIALQMALTNDQRIAIARGDEKISGLDYRESKQAFGPTVSVEGDYRTSEGADPKDPFTTKFNPADQWNGWFRISQSLLDARLFPARRRDAALWAASSSDYTNTVRERLLIVAVGYYRAIQAQTIQTVADQALQLANLEVQRATLRVQAGEARQTDLLRAQVDSARAERAFNEARNDVVLAARDLFRLVGLPPEATITVQPPSQLPEPGTDSLPDLLAAGKKHRSDIAAARQRIAAASENEKVAKNDSLPKISAEYDEQLASPDIYQKGRDTWAVYLVAKMDLWDKGHRGSERLRRLERIEQEKRRLEAAEKTAASETERALATLGVARLNYATAQREEELADKNFGILSEQAKNGLATALDVSTALVDLTRSRMDKVRLQYEVEIAKITLQSAIGQFPAPLEK